MTSQAANQERLEPYNLEQCTVKIMILMHPKKNSGKERDCVIAVSTHEDLPLTQVIKLSELRLSKPIIDLLHRLKTELPEREFHAKVKHKKAKTSKRKEKAVKSSKSSEQNAAIPDSAESSTSNVKQVQLF